MAKILNTDDLMEIVTVEELPGMEAEMDAIEAAVEALATKIAAHYGINKGGTSWHAGAPGELATCFYPKEPNQLCPDPINDGDPGGDWEYRETLK